MILLCKFISHMITSFCLIAFLKDVLFMDGWKYWLTYIVVIAINWFLINA